MNLGLKHCKAFIAGASKGLGKACAKALADEAARAISKRSSKLRPNSARPVIQPPTFPFWQR